MPVIVVGADVQGGDAIVARLLERDGQVRVFVTDKDAAARFRAAGAKVATGDVTDFGHLQAAMTRCFCAVLLTEAAIDGRERSFANDPEAVIGGWRRALKDAAVQRGIWVAGEDVAPATPEHAHVLQAHEDLPGRIADLDDAVAL